MARKESDILKSIIFPDMDLDFRFKGFKEGSSMARFTS